MSMAKTTLLLAALAASAHAITTPSKPEITPAPLPKRDAQSDPPYDVLGPPDQYFITDLGPSTSIVSYDGSSYHVRCPRLLVNHELQLTTACTVHRGPYQVFLRRDDNRDS